MTTLIKLNLGFVGLILVTFWVLKSVELIQSVTSVLQSLPIN